MSTAITTCPRCGRRRAVDAIQAGPGTRYSACDECRGAGRPPSPGRDTRQAPQDVRPWTPWQIAAVSVLLGVGVCGLVAGLNFIRLGKRQYLIPSIVVGSVLFIAIAAVVLFLVPDEAARIVGLLASSAAGFGFMLVQKPYFEAWKVVNWTPRPGDRYRPNGLGQLALASLLGLGLEIGVIALLVTLAEVRPTQLAPGGALAADRPTRPDSQAAAPPTATELFTVKAYASFDKGVAFSPDGKRLASAGQDQALKLWDVVTGEEVRTFKGHTSAIASVAFSPAGKRLASGSHDETLKVWELSN